MKKAFTLLLIFAGFCGRANDTLTRAQVYDFNVGDTFDYRNYSDNGYAGPDTSYSTLIVNYTRYVISNIYYSIDSSVKYISRTQIFPTPTLQDTLVLSDPEGREIILDTIFLYNNFGPDSAIVAPLPDYFSRRTNYITFFCCGPGQEEILFAQGLGQAIVYIKAGDMGYYEYDSTVLIYYSGDSGTFGSPYYDFPTAIQSVNTQDAQINLFPTVNDGSFTVKIPVGSLLPVNLAVYDITGREVKAISLTELNNPVTMNNCSGGVYVWKAFSKNGLLQTGKMIVH